jgi:small nuclear ribonucleoprotein (snRNP)-like protein
MSHSAAERDPVLDFAKYTDQRVRVRFQGGREVEGVLKGKSEYAITFFGHFY